VVFDESSTSATEKDGINFVISWLGLVEKAVFSSCGAFFERSKEPQTAREDSSPNSFGLHRRPERSACWEEPSTSVRARSFLDFFVRDAGTKEVSLDDAVIVCCLLP
jgi:hypothetical protein